ncbi:MAG: aminoglycoside 6'-N-acetyltransferase [Candidatus Limivicinus sp.]
MDIIRAGLGEVNSLVELAVLLWPEHQVEALEQEFSLLMTENKAAFFLARAGELPVGFAQCALRHDYVEGTSTSPVGYLEGIYVQEEHRREGVAAGLLSACETWARQRGCREFASDCGLDNAQSLRFHLAAGFEEANRIICFTKKL